MLNFHYLDYFYKMRLNLRLSQIMMILFGVIFISLTSSEQSWAQDSTLSEGLVQKLFSEESKVVPFFLFIIGIGIYSIFVWYFYRFISKRDCLPAFFYPLSVKHKPEIKKIVIASISQAVVFPIIIFVWFIVLAFFIFLISKEMPFEIALFVSMAIIAVVRILSYYREDAAKEVAKMIPYAILSVLLTSAALYSDPNFFSEKQLSSIPDNFVEHFEQIITAIIVVTIFEYVFRLSFMVKRKLLPISDKILEEEIENQVESIVKAHFEKMEEQETHLRKKLEELMQKLKDYEKNNS